MPKFVFAFQAREPPHILFLSKLTSVPLITMDHFQFIIFNLKSFTIPKYNDII